MPKSPSLSARRQPSRLSSPCLPFSRLSPSLSARLQPRFYRQARKNGPLAVQKALDALDRHLQTTEGKSQYLFYLRSRIRALYSCLGLSDDFELDDFAQKEIRSRLGRLRIVWAPAAPFSYAAPSAPQTERYLFSRYGAFARLMVSPKPSASLSSTDESTLRLCSLPDLEHELLHVASALYYCPYSGRRGWLARTLYAPLQMLEDLGTRHRLFSTHADFEQILSEDPAFALEEGLVALLSRHTQTYLSLQSALVRALRALPRKSARSEMAARLIRTWLNTASPAEADAAYQFVRNALQRSR